MYKNKSYLDADAQYELSRIVNRYAKIAGVCLGIVSIIAGALMIKENDVMSYALIIAGIVLIVLFLFFWERRFKSEIAKSIKKKQLFDSTTYNDFVFNAKDFVATAYRQDQNIGVSTYPYNMLVKVIETTNYILMYITKNQAFIVKKDNTYEGSSDDIVRILKNEVKEYKIRK